VSAGVRFSDLFTDVSYIVAVPSLTTLGWILLLPPPFLNLVGVVIMDFQNNPQGVDDNFTVSL
jgi:hypothetical protein